MKEERGITLIALIITIIVMLILVGVTVTVALNGGLFTTAKKAATDTEKARVEEQILEATIGSVGDNGEVNIEKLNTELAKINEITFTPGNTFPVTVTYKDETTSWNIYKNGKVEKARELAWYELTDAEKAELEAIEGAVSVEEPDEEEETPGYIGYQIVSGDPEIRVICKYSGEPVFIMIDGTAADPQDEYHQGSGYVYFFDENYNDFFEDMGLGAIDELDVNTWYYYPVGSHLGESAVPNTNPFPTAEFASSTINCQSYYNKIVASFGN